MAYIFLTVISLFDDEFDDEFYDEFDEYNKSLFYRFKKVLSQLPDFAIQRLFNFVKIYDFAYSNNTNYIENMINYIETGSNVFLQNIFRNSNNKKNIDENFYKGFGIVI